MNQLLQNIQLPAYDFIDFPVQTNRKEVEHVLQLLMQQTSKMAGLTGMYIRENTVFPEMGDIEVYYVVNDIVEDYALKKGLLPALGKIRQNNPILKRCHFFNVSTFQHYEQIRPFAHLKFQFGQQEIRFATLTQEYRDFCYLLALNDMILMSPLPKLVGTLIEGTIHVPQAWDMIRDTLEMIETFIQIRKRIPPSWKEYQIKCHELGRAWFSMNLNRFQELKELLRESLIIQLGLIDELHKWIRSDNLYFIQQNSAGNTEEKPNPNSEEFRAAFISEGIRALFMDKWTPEFCFNRIVNLYRKKKEYCQYLPTLLSVPYVMYYRGIYHHSTLLQKAFIYHGYAANVAVPEAVQMRNKTLSDYLQFYELFNYLMEEPAWLGYTYEEPSRLAKFLDRFLENHRKEQHMKWLKNTSLELARA